MKITIRYGLGNEIVRNDIAEGTTLGQLIADARIKAGLGYSGNVEGHIGSVVQDGGLRLQNGMAVDIHDKACQKA